MAAQLQSQLAQQIVDTLKTICSHDINYIDVDGRISASTNVDRVNSYHAGGHEAARLGKIVTIETDSPTGDVLRGINMPIRFHGNTVAVIGITGEPEEVKKYADLAQRLTLLLLREHEINERNYNARTQTGYLVRALAAGETVTKEFTATVLEQNGLTDHAQLWRTVVIQLCDAPQNPLSTVEAAIEDVVRRMKKCLWAFQFPHEYLMIIQDRETEGWQRALADLANGFSGDLKIGIGSARHLHRQDLSCQAARIAISSLEGKQNMAAYDALRLEILLGSVPAAASSAYIQKCLKGLDQSDRELLRLYFSSELSLKQTAQQCFLHINTLQYRLKRIRDRCGIDPRSFRGAAMLYMALRLEKKNHHATS